MLVHPKTVVEQHDRELEGVHQHEAHVGPRHEPPEREQEPGTDRRGEVGAEQQGHAGRGQHAKSLAPGYERPADRLGLRVDEGRDPLVHPVEIGDDVQEGHRRAVPAEGVVALDLGDLRTEEPADRPHGGSLAYVVTRSHFAVWLPPGHIFAVNSKGLVGTGNCAL